MGSEEYLRGPGHDVQGLFFDWNGLESFTTLYRALLHLHAVLTPWFQPGHITEVDIGCSVLDIGCLERYDAPSTTEKAI